MNTVQAKNAGFASGPEQIRTQARLGRGSRILIAILAGILLLTGVGVVYQMRGTAVDRSAYPPPGQLVEMGGYTMHIYCTGQGSPTVILDHVGAANSAQWAIIQPLVAAETRVCAYDRAGFGWSESSPDPQDAQHNAQQLHTLLANAGIDGPFILVGHSFGANVSRVFAATYPNETAGLVLVDPGNSYNRPGLPADINARWQSGDNGFIMAAPILSRIGLIRLGSELGATPGHRDLPAPQAQAFDALQITPQFYDTVKAQQLAMADTSVQVLAAEARLGSLPISVLSAGLPLDSRDRQVWTETNAQIAALSPNGIHREIAGADHMALALSQQYAPITAEAILDMLALVRAEQQ